MISDKGKGKQDSEESKKDQASGQDTGKLRLTPDTPESFFNRELSWLGFARRVLSLAGDQHLQLMERVKFAGIMGMLHDEFFMKRISGLKRGIKRGATKTSQDGRTPVEEFTECRAEILDQIEALAQIVNEQIKPALKKAKIPIQDYSDLSKKQREQLKGYFETSVQPVLTPLAVDAEHPFPFISNLGLNLAVQLRDENKRKRFARIKVPDNIPRWVPIEGSSGFVPLEQVIAANISLLFGENETIKVYVFRVTRGADSDERESQTLAIHPDDIPPASIISTVTSELKARRFAGIVRLEVNPDMPDKLLGWLSEQLGISDDDIYVTGFFLGLSDLMKLKADGNPELHYPVHQPVTHQRLRDVKASDPDAIFDEIKKGDILLHHPYHSFDTSVLHFLRCAAVDPKVLAIKLTIYRTSPDSPIIEALVEAAQRGKQVAVLVEITARFDEMPNISWGQLLEREGAHVAYGVERLKTHVKLAMVIREEPKGIKRYCHIGTGNYHTGTARIYEDLGMLTCDPVVCEDAAHVFNELTGATPYHNYKRLLVAPRYMRNRFVELVQREARHAMEGRPCGIRAKMNQLQDPGIIGELYKASQAGVPVTLNVRGLNCLRPGLSGLSENIRVYSVVGRFLEHSRIYHFVNGGEDEYYIGSADWMRRNLDRRVETITPVLNKGLQQELSAVISVYEQDNCSAWDCRPDGTYARRQPGKGEACICAQEQFIRLAHESAEPGE